MRTLLVDGGRFARDFAASMFAPVTAASGWRQRRLLILGYHGISLEDEHLWDGGIYMSPDTFRRRLAILQKLSCAVLPLERALRLLDEGKLPPRAVSIVFDDGFHDFARMAAPILGEYNHTATVFLSSYYAEYNRPIFDIALRYILWKSSGQTLVLPDIIRQPIHLDAAGQIEARDLIRHAAFADSLSGSAKNKLLARLADALQIDYDLLCRKRLLHMMNANEVREVRTMGHDVQMHTHRHRVSRNRELFEREIHDNRAWIRKTLGGAAPVHFSYPGGVWQPVERDWLVKAGVETATTCTPALADVRSDKLRLPRVVDHAHVSERLFRAWVSGSMALFPKGKVEGTPGQILEETIGVPAASPYRS